MPLSAASIFGLLRLDIVTGTEKALLDSLLILVAIESLVAYFLDFNFFALLIRSVQLVSMFFHRSFR
jgi:hypothetical protein